MRTSFASRPSAKPVAKRLRNHMFLRDQFGDEAAAGGNVQHIGTMVFGSRPKSAPSARPSATPTMVAPAMMLLNGFHRMAVAGTTEHEQLVAHGGQHRRDFGQQILRAATDHDGQRTGLGAWRAPDTGASTNSMPFAGEDGTVSRVSSGFGRAHVDADRAGAQCVQQRLPLRARQHLLHHLAIRQHGDDEIHGGELRQ